MHRDDHVVELSAYIDGELMPEEIMAIREHLASCGDCAAEYEALRAVSGRVKEGFEQPRAPEALRARIRESLRAAALADDDEHARSTPQVTALPPRRLPWLRLIAAGLVIAVASSGGSFAIARRGASAPTAADEVLASHIRSLMPGHLTDVTSNDTHNVKPWFNGRIDLSPNVPRLDSLGFPLVGGRLDYIGGRAVASVVYSRRQHVISVFSWPSDRGTGSRVVSNKNGYHLVHWSTDGTDYWAASDVNVADLEQFVDLFTRADGAVKERE